MELWPFWSLVPNEFLSWGGALGKTLRGFKEEMDKPNEEDEYFEEDDENSSHQLAKHLSKRRTKELSSYVFLLFGDGQTISLLIQLSGLRRVTNFLTAVLYIQSLVNLAEVAELIVGVEALGDFFGGELFFDLGVGFEQLFEVTAGGVPGLVGIGLHNAVGVFAVDAFFDQGEQHALAEDNAAVEVHVALHVLWVDLQAF